MPSPPPLHPLGRLGLAAMLLGGCVPQAPELNGLSGGLSGGTWGDVELSTGGSGSGSESDGDGDGAVLLDVPEAAPEPTCAKMDFLFVIDNSGSMQDEQENLVASFDGFMNAMASTVGTADAHVMVVDTDGRGGLAECTGSGCCEAVCSSDPAWWCNGVPCSVPSSEEQIGCDERIGAGQIASSDGTECAALDGHRYLATSSIESLAESFSCAASVGAAGGTDERPIEAIRSSLRMSAFGGCNEAFLRDDAFLVVTIVTDEDDVATTGSPDEWVEEIVAFKQGRRELVVVLGLLGDPDLPDGVCTPRIGSTGASPAPRLREFVSSFPAGQVGSVCAEHYDPFFLDSVTAIRSECESFGPVR